MPLPLAQTPGITVKKRGWGAFLQETAFGGLPDLQEVAGSEAKPDDAQPPILWKAKD